MAVYLISEKTWVLRQEILRLLGGHCVCPCDCQDTNLRHLQLDHPEGGGRDDRKSIRGQAAYTKLLAEIKSLESSGTLNPSTYPLNPLCANCHFEKTMHGKCEREVNYIETQEISGELREENGGQEEQGRERGVHHMVLGVNQSGKTSILKSQDTPVEKVPWWRQIVKERV